MHAIFLWSRSSIRKWNSSRLEQAELLKNSQQKAEVNYDCLGGELMFPSCRKNTVQKICSKEISYRYLFFWTTKLTSSKNQCFDWSGGGWRLQLEVITIRGQLLFTHTRWFTWMMQKRRTRLITQQFSFSVLLDVFTARRPGNALDQPDRRVTFSQTRRICETARKFSWRKLKRSHKIRTAFNQFGSHKCNEQRFLQRISEYYSASTRQCVI